MVIVILCCSGKTGMSRIHMHYFLALREYGNSNAKKCIAILMLYISNISQNKIRVPKIVNVLFPVYLYLVLVGGQVWIIKCSLETQNR